MDWTLYALLKNQIKNAVADGEAAIPEIGENGNWWVDGEDTGVEAVPVLTEEDIDNILEEETI